jgi:hypothetical protein
VSLDVERAQVGSIFLLQSLVISLNGAALAQAPGYVAAWVGGHSCFIHLSAEVYPIATLRFAPHC